MSFLSQSELQKLNFKNLGKNVLIRNKASIYNQENISIGDNSRMDDFCVISGSVTIGQNVHIAVFCNIAGGTAGITPQDFSGWAYGVHVLSQSDDYSGLSMTNSTVLDKFKNETKAPIIIDRQCISGVYSIIFTGVGVPRSPILASILTVFSRVRLFYLGIIGEYIGRMHFRVMDRPTYLVSENIKEQAGMKHEQAFS